MVRFICAALLGLLATFSPAAGQQDFSKVSINSVEVAPGIFMLQGRGGNIAALVGDDGVVLVDDQFAPLTKKIKTALAKLSAKPVRFVVNTHWHGDHTGGNENFGKSGSVIVAHKNVRKRLSTDQVVKAFGRQVKALSKEGWPVVTFDQDVTLHLNGHAARIQHVPNAHTDGDSFIFFKTANVIHTGDIFFNGFFPFIDSGSGGTVAGMLGAVELILSKIDGKTKIIPGHGPLAAKRDLVAYRDMLQAVNARIGKLKRDGKTLKQVQAAKPLADYDEKWGQGFLNTERFIAIAYGAL